LSSAYEKGAKTKVFYNFVQSVYMKFQDTTDISTKCYSTLLLP